jgi:hypothetical protein
MKKEFQYIIFLVFAFALATLIYFLVAASKN